MEHPENLLWLLAVAALLLLISFLGKKAEWLLNFALRGIMGTIAIYFINMGVTFLGFTTVVGINAVSILTTGILGIPGIVMLYGLSIYEINALQKRYQHLTELAALQPADREKNLYQHSPIRALVSHVFG